jgi:hypothetical protein
MGFCTLRHTKIDSKKKKRACYVLPTKTSLLRSQSFGVSVSFPRTFTQVPATSLTALVFLFVFVAVALSLLNLVLILLIHPSFVLRSLMRGRIFASYSPLRVWIYSPHHIYRIPLKGSHDHSLWITVQPASCPFNGPS